MTVRLQDRIKNAINALYGKQPVVVCGKCKSAPAPAPAPAKKKSKNSGECQHCGRWFGNVWAHKQRCPMNPVNKHKVDHDVIGSKSGRITKNVPCPHCGKYKPRERLQAHMEWCPKNANRVRDIPFERAMPEV